MRVWDIMGLNQVGLNCAFQFLLGNSLVTSGKLDKKKVIEISQNLWRREHSHATTGLVLRTFSSQVEE